MKKFNFIRILVLAVSLLLQLHALCFHSHGATGDVDLSFDPGSGVDGRVTAVVLQADGKVVIAGYFTTVKGLLRTNLARLNADGSGDPTFDAGLAGNSITALALQADGKLLVAGNFPQIYCDESGCAEYYATSVVQLNTNGSRDTNFTPATAEYYSQSGEFSSLATQPDGKILVGGIFSSVSGAVRVGVARLHANGTLDTNFNTGAGPNGTVQFVALQPDNKALIGGRFTTFDGTNCSSLARLNANGTLDSSFNPDFGVRHYRDCGGDVCYTVSFPTAATMQPDGKVLVGVWRENWQCDAFEGGCFTSHSYSMTRLNANGTSDSNFAFTNHLNNVALLGLVDSIAVQSDGKIVVGSSAYNTVKIARINANGSWDNSFNAGVGQGGVDAVALQADGKVLIGGTFATVNGTNRNHIARLNTNGGLDLSFGSGLGLNRAVSQLALQPDGKVLVGGPLVVGDPFFGPASDTLAFVNGTNRHGRTRLNADGSLDSGFIPTPFHPPLEARYHTEDCPGSPYGCIYGFTSAALLVQTDGKMLMSGTFVTTVYGDETFFQVYHSFLGRFSATGGLESEFNLPDVYVTAMAEQPDGKIVIGGSLTLNGTNSTVARLNANGSVDGSFQLGQGPISVSSLALQPDGKIVVGGASAIARLNGNGSRDLSFGPVLLSNGAAYSLALQPDGKVVIGGSFTNVNGTNRNRIARLNANGSLDNSFNPGTGTDGRVLSIALQPDGNVLIGGEFKTVNGVVRPYVARLFGDSIAPSPSLSITRSNSFVILSWPAMALNFQLQEATNLAPPNSWFPVAQPAVTNGNQISVTVPTLAPNKFLRLISQ